MLRPPCATTTIHAGTQTIHDSYHRWNMHLMKNMFTQRRNTFSKTRVSWKQRVANALRTFITFGATHTQYVMLLMSIKQSSQTWKWKSLSESLQYGITISGINKNCIHSYEEHAYTQRKNIRTVRPDWAGIRDPSFGRPHTKCNADVNYIIEKIKIGIRNIILWNNICN